MCGTQFPTKSDAGHRNATPSSKPDHNVLPGEGASMSEAGWKLVVDRQGVTIENDRFQLTANGAPAPEMMLDLEDAVAALDEALPPAAESRHMEAIVSALHAMTRRTYGQFCGLSRAMEIVGERWAMLIVRDLLVSPRRLTDLQHGLPRIPADVLSTRLRELEHAGIITRRPAAEPDGAPRYELTELGTGLQEVALALSRWGAQLLDEPRPEDVVTPASLIMALRTAFRPDAAGGRQVSFELRVRGVVCHVRVDDGVLRVEAGPLPTADLVIKPGLALSALLTGEISPAEALDTGAVRVTGDPALLTTFLEIFQIPKPPTAVG
jgi:DNA-binding HxlR family transcriptional regulator